jgi:CubicO group peptidase (beta-lactamase class C family)
MIITKTTGLKALDFGKKYLFKPLGISNLQWDEARGHSVGGWGLQLTSRDMAKIGYLYLNKGRWGRRQILTQEWVEESTQMQVKIPEEIPSSWVRELLERSTTYGYLWWVDITGGHPSFFVVGHGGQFIHAIPDLDIVLVITTVPMGGSDSKYFAIIDDFVVPSVIKQ